jgi:hypothetical protein
MNRRRAVTVVVTTEARENMRESNERESKVVATDGEREIEHAARGRRCMQSPKPSTTKNDRKGKQKEQLFCAKTTKQPKLQRQ